MLEELPENIWLARTYRDIDEYNNDPAHYWSVIAEIDMSASVAGFSALLFNDENMIRKCNIIPSDT
jgi:hypothetical protein